MQVTSVQRVSHKKVEKYKTDEQRKCNVFSVRKKFEVKYPLTKTQQITQVKWCYFVVNCRRQGGQRFDK